MYELIKVTERCYYIDCPSKIGIILDGDGSGVYLIDSGNSRDTGKKVLKVLNQNGWKLKAIYNTHSHADHIGGNKYLQSQTGCKIYARGIECDFTRHTILEPAFLYGAYPTEELKHKFLLAEECDAEYLTEDKLPCGIKMLSLPGHSFDMVGFISDDGAAFIADSYSSEETLNKYAVSFIYDVKAYLETLEKLKNTEAKVFIPSHAPVSSDISEIAQYNIGRVYEVADKITSACDTPSALEEILKKVFDSFSLSMSFEQYALVGSAVRSYLTWLKSTGKIKVEFKENRLLWEKV